MLLGKKTGKFSVLLKICTCRTG